MKRSRTEKSPWIKSKTKLGPNKKKIDEFHSHRGQDLTILTNYGFVEVRFFHFVLSFVDHGYVCLLESALRHLLLGLLLFWRSRSLHLHFAHSLVYHG